jgi:hypothetical protein
LWNFKGKSGFCANAALWLAGLAPEVVADDDAEGNLQQQVDDQQATPHVRLRFYLGRQIPGVCLQIAMGGRGKSTVDARVC